MGQAYFLAVVVKALFKVGFDNVLCCVEIYFVNEISLQNWVCSHKLRTKSWSKGSNWDVMLISLILCSFIY